MTANEIINKATDYLGYRDATGESNIDEITKKNMLTFVNTVYSDLMFIAGEGVIPQIASLSDKITGLSERSTQALIFGVCMWVAFNSGDGDKHAMFTKLYNDYRTGLSKGTQIVNKIPAPEG